MATRLPAKSILKQEPPDPKPTLSDEQKAQAERNCRNMSIALHHATRIQHQKDTQAQILANIETLLDYPIVSAPTTSDASFVALVHPFQPSDFDSLVEERRIDGKCGYALCPNAPRSVTMGSSAAWKLKGQGAEDYCSNNCLRKALYVKSQLSEVPAWEREPEQQPHIVLQDGDASSPSATAGASRNGNRELSARNGELALERGEAVSSFRPGEVMTSDVVEKATVSHKPSVAVNHSGASHTAIEGYEPTSNFTQDYESGRAELLDVDDFVANDATPPADRDPSADKDEREAWRHLFENIDRP